MDVGLKRFARLSLAVSIAIMLSGGFGACTKSPVLKSAMPQSLSGVVRFTVLVPGAKQVSLVGSFNEWTKGATPMKIVHGSALWTVDVPLKAGEYTFMYLIDGVRWVTPPLADDFVTDGFGQTNGIVIVR
jgi:1,4-alpha-glucan branching enzyme